MTKGFSAILMAMSLCDGDVDTYGFTGGGAADVGTHGFTGGGAADGSVQAEAPRYHYWELPISANSELQEFEAMRLEHALLRAMANVPGSCKRVRGVTCPQEAAASGRGARAIETSPRRAPCRAAKAPSPQPPSLPEQALLPAARRGTAARTGGGPRSPERLHARPAASEHRDASRGGRDHQA